MLFLAVALPGRGELGPDGLARPPVEVEAPTRPCPLCTETGIISSSEEGQSLEVWQTTDATSKTILQTYTSIFSLMLSHTNLGNVTACCSFYFLVVRVDLKNSCTNSELTRTHLIDINNFRIYLLVFF